MITQHELKDYCHYDPIAGLFTQGQGRLLGYIRDNGTMYLRINNKRYDADKLAWLYTYGVYPDTIVHHDGDLTNNRIGNLGLRSKLEDSIILCDELIELARAMKYNTS